MQNNISSRITSRMNGNESELLNDVYRDISDNLGLDAAIEVYQLFKSQQITFPVHLFSRKRIQKMVSREYDGTNINMLAQKYGYSEKTIRRIIKDNKPVV